MVVETTRRLSDCLLTVASRTAAARWRSRAPGTRLAASACACARGRRAAGVAPSEWDEPATSRWYSHGLKDSVHSPSPRASPAQTLG
jgi:hypothetical protein